jgi:hypothetical protein
MSKQGGLGQRLLVGGYDISGDIQALNNVHGGPALQDVTDITQSAHARLGLLRDGGFGASVFMDAANAHPVLSALPVADALATYLLSTALGGGPVAACCVAKQIGYDPTRSAAGDLLLKTQFDANGYGLEWGEPLTAGLRTDTTATAGAFVDDGAATNFGGQAYLQVTGFTGTSVTVKIQHCATSGGSYTDVAGLTFTAVTAAPAWQRIASSNSLTINEFVKVTTTGTFSSATFAVVFVRNKVAGQVF